MSAAVPIVGVNATVELTPVGGGSVIVIKNSDWSIEPGPAIFEAPNTTDGMLRVAGLQDYKGEIKGSTDATSPTTAIESQVKGGAIYTAKFYRSKGSNLYFGGTVILGPPKIGTGLSTVENYTIPFMKQSGVLTFPDGSTQ